MTDIQAALGLSQMRKLDTFIARRNELANQYRKLLADLPIEMPPSAPDGFFHGYHLFAVLVPNRARVFSELRAQGLGVQVHYVPVHLHPSTASILGEDQTLGITEQVYNGLISLPIHPGLGDSEMSSVVSLLAESLHA